MGKVLKIQTKQSDDVLNIVEDTLANKKQVIVFVNTKRGAESQAERIANKIKNIDMIELSEDVLNVLPTPTKQCKRLSICVKKGTAFHHAGLTNKQRELVEDNFRNGNIKVICATPTLAMGVDLPAFRVIIRDLKRYGGRWGMQDIPVLEYEQQAGRAGRPGKEDYGEAICIAKTESEKETIFEKYIHGEHEEIYSKLAVEPILRTHVLSLISSEYVHDKKSLFEFFDKTFYAHQYEDTGKLHGILEKIIGLLKEWEFLKDSGQGNFVSANELENEKLESSLLGKRVSELYLDPYTAFFIMEGLRKATSKEKLYPFALIHLFTNTLELRPLLRVKTFEYEEIQGKMLEYYGNLLVDEPSAFDESYDEFLNSIKTAYFLNDWIEEKNEEYLLGKYDVRPGEIHGKLEITDWLVYSAEELARLMKFHSLIKELAKLRLRLKYGAGEEILPLLKLKNIGRVRARKMFNNKLKTITEIKNVDITTLAQLIGKSAAISVKSQLGQEYDPKKVAVRENKRKGQISLKAFEDKK